MSGATPIERPGGVAARGFLIVMVDGYDTLMVAFVAPLLARRWGLGPGELGSLFAAGYLGAVIGGLTMGTVADRVGRRPVLVGCLLLAAIATALAGWAPDLASLRLLRLLAGIGLGGAVPITIALTADHARPARRGATITAMYIGFPLGAVLGGALTAALLGWGVTAIFGGAAALCVLAAIAAATMPRSPPRTGRRGNALAQFGEGRAAPALALWAGLFCLLVVTYFLLSWTPLLLVGAGASAKLAALAPVLLNLGGIAGALASARVIDRFGPYLPGATLLLAGAVALAVLGRAIAGGPLALVALFVTGMLLLGPQLTFPAMAAELFPPAVRATGAGWLSGVGRLGSIVGPLVGGLLVARRFGPPELLLFTAVPALVAAGSLLFAHGRTRTTRSASA